MGLLDDQSHQQYYQGNDLGNYQFVSLEDIINQFMVVYVGDQKIISKARRVDVAFHAQRALAELSFDTFKSIKAQEIVVPPTLQMVLPHDYVNYTKLSWSDSSGIKHPLYSTNSTSNPFSILQNSNGNYAFPTHANLGVNTDFSDPQLLPWQQNTPEDGNVPPSGYWIWNNGTNGTDGYTNYTDEISIVGTNNALTFKQHVHQSYGHNQSQFYCVWQEINVENLNTISLAATGVAEGPSTNTVGGTITIGVSSIVPVANTISYVNSSNTSSNVSAFDADSASNFLLSTSAGDVAQLKWTNGENNVYKELVGDDEIDVSSHDIVYVVITSRGDFNTSAATHATHASTTYTTLFTTNTIDEIVITSEFSSQPLSQKNDTGHSETWKSYKSATPSENNNDDYEDNTYWPMNGERYGLDPQHAQANGSFFINQRLGKIHFSSNIAGKTVILDYVSDSLGTDGEMQVHKFAEDAMYKWITHAVLSGSSYGQQLVPRLTKEKFAATRKAKLRLSNFKLEELTQILRGKSKQIKH